MAEAGVRKLGSSATVYGDPDVVPVWEDYLLRPENPYSQSKAMAEQILKYFSCSGSAWKIATLRYFNPVGAHESGRIGEDPRGIFDNFMPFVTQMAVGRRESLNVYSGDYSIPGGEDMLTANLGTGCGYNVLEMVEAIRQASGKDAPYWMSRESRWDVACYYADPCLAELELNGHSERDLDRRCRDACRCQRMNPDGNAYGCACDT